MKRAPIPPDEQARLKVLNELGILDSEPDDWLDLITAYCRSRFRVPICLVSLVDADRQWFMSSSGLAVQETPRSISFCGHAVADDSLLVVTDASRDIRFIDNPLVMREPQVRFYAGSPIRVKSQPIGTLCIIDQRARDLTADDAAELAEISDAISWFLAHRPRQPSTGAGPRVEAIAHPGGTTATPSTDDDDGSDPWRAAVDYMQAHPHSVEARMLAQVAFAYRGSGRDRHVFPWEESVLDQRAVSIARRMIAARSSAVDAREDGRLRSAKQVQRLDEASSRPQGTN